MSAYYSRLGKKERVGFFWTTYDPENPRPDAWCADCEERVKKTDGEWVGEAEDHLKPQVLCGACYDMAKIFHMGGRSMVLNTSNKRVKPAPFGRMDLANRSAPYPNR